MKRLARNLLFVCCFITLSVTMGTYTASAQSTGTLVSLSGGTASTPSATFVPLANLGAGNGSKLATIYSSNSLAGYVNALFTFALSLGAIAAVLRIAYAGYMYMGTDSFGNKSEAKKIIQDTVIGLLLLLSVYLILYQINPDILKLNILSEFSQ